MSTGTRPATAASVRLRALHWRDIPELVSLEAEAFGPDAWSAPTWWRELAARPRRWYTVAIDDADRLLGYAGLDLAGEVADVMTIAVAPAARGTGTGQFLLEALIDRARSSGAGALLLEVRADNDSALRLYDRNGFARIATRRRYYQPGDVDAIVMRRPIVAGPAGEQVDRG